MKRTQLEKARGKRIVSDMRRATTPARFAGEAQGSSRKDRQNRDRALGLVPFAVKLPAGLVDRLRRLAVERDTPLNDITEQLLRAALRD